MALMPVAEALARVLAGADPLAAEFVPLTEAHGRVLAADVAALRTSRPPTSPPWTAMRCAAIDVAQVPARLRLIGEVAAGHPFQGSVGAGEAARIFTGGVVPPGADAIVVQEKHGAGGRHRRRRNEAQAKASTSASRGSISPAARCSWPRADASATAISLSPQP